jgi:hypothetical protein
MRKGVRKSEIVGDERASERASEKERDRERENQEAPVLRRPWA